MLVHRQEYGSHGLLALISSVDLPECLYGTVLPACLPAAAALKATCRPTLAAPHTAVSGPAGNRYSPRKALYLARVRFDRKQSCADGRRVCESRNERLMMATVDRNHGALSWWQLMPREASDRASL